MASSNTDKWIGVVVSIRLRDEGGSYQGKITSAKRDRLILSRAFFNGLPCDRDEVSIP